jgi:hypothetical protein
VLVALAMQLEHAVDQVLHRAALFARVVKSRKVLLAGREVVWQVRRPHALVTGDVVFRLRVHGVELVGELAQYEPRT